MKIFTFICAFYAFFTIVYCQVDDKLKQGNEIEHTEDVRKISDIMTQNNKRIEDNIKKFDDSTRTKVTAILTNNSTKSSSPKQGSVTTTPNDTDSSSSATTTANKNSYVFIYGMMIYGLLYI